MRAVRPACELSVVELISVDQACCGASRALPQPACAQCSGGRQQATGGAAERACSLRRSRWLSIQTPTLSTLLSQAKSSDWLQSMKMSS